MSSHPRKSLQKTNKTKHPKLSSTVLDYYYKYGENRDLEKYLRFKRSTSKSSSDSSSRNNEYSSFRSDYERITKSMDKLHLPENPREKNIKSRETKSTENISETSNQSQNEKQASNDSNEENRIKIEKKTQQTVNNQSKSKLYNFNLESSIELTLPPSHSLPGFSKVFSSTASNNKSPTKNVSLETTHTQTEEFFPMNQQNQFIDSLRTHTDARPFGLEQSRPVEKPKLKKSISLGKSKKDGALRVEESILETSPASSVASAKRLEWDSMADVGYNKIIDFKSQSNGNLSTFEKNALTKFFARRGLNFDDNLVIIAPSDARSPLQKRKFTQSAVEMRETKKYTSDANKLSPATSKHLWDRALDKYRQKYGKAKDAAAAVAESTSEIDSMQFMSVSMAPPHHSTPVAAEIIKKPVDPIIAKVVLTQDKCENTEPERVEKSCQTGGIQFETIGIQVDEQKLTYTSRPVQTDISHGSRSVRIDDEDLSSVATSFEFLASNFYQKCAKKNQIAPIAADISSDLQQTNAIPHRYDTQREAFNLQKSNPDEKENIPPIENKENIPPQPLHVMHHDDRSSDYVTPEQSEIDKSDMDTTSTLPTDLQKSVELINALIDSRKLDGTTKKKLLRRIVRKIIKFKDTKEITQMIMSSYSDESNGNPLNSSESSSVELNGSNETFATKMKSKNRQELSGVSTLSSTSDAASDKRSVHEKQNESSPCIITTKSMQQEISGITTLSSSSNATKPQEIETKDEANQSQVKDWLLPVTQSEIERENSRRALNKSTDELMAPSNEKESVSKHSKVVAVNGDDNGSRPASKPIKATTSNEIFDFLENEKRTHFNWIDQEIEHLKNLKLLLQNIKANETDESKDVSEEKINSVYAKHNRDYLIIYENLKRSGKNENEKQLILNVSDSFIDSTTSTDKSIARNKPNRSSNGRWTREPISESLESESPSEMQSKSNNKDKLHEKMVAQRRPKDHINIGQSCRKNRTKLETPNSDESNDESYAKACHTKYEKKCSKNRGKNKYYDKAIRKIIDANQPIYTKPCTSDSYSDIQRIAADNNKNNFKRTGTIDGYSSISGSDAFVSSNSISIGMGANSTSNTTTHQYDTKISVGIQTSNTLRRMQPIQLKKSTICIEKQPQIHPGTTTVRVNKLTFNKNIQARPESLAYIIMFRDNAKTSKSNTKSKNSKSNLNDDNVSNNNNQQTAPKSNGNVKKNAVNRIERRSSNGDDSLESLNSLSTDENLTLQEYLQTHRPDFMANAEQRRKCVNNLHNLRQQRNELRKQLFAMNTCMNAKTLNKNMKRLLPPQPLAQMRIFSSKEIVNRTRRKYQKLPEIRHRHQMERDIKIRRNQRILVNVFNKHLQKHVLSGRTDLSNSMMVN